MHPFSLRSRMGLFQNWPSRSQGQAGALWSRSRRRKKRFAWLFWGDPGPHPPHHTDLGSSFFLCSHLSMYVANSHRAMTTESFQWNSKETLRQKKEAEEEDHLGWKPSSPLKASARNAGLHTGSFPASLLENELQNIDFTWLPKKTPLWLVKQFGCAIIWL